MLKTIQNTLIKIEGLIAASSLALLLFLSLLQILLRNFFYFGYPEIDILNRQLLLLCGMMGAVLATSQLQHIKIDALNTLLSVRTKKQLRCPLSMFSAIVCVLLAYYAAQFCIDEWQYAPTNERWLLPFTLIYPVGFSLLGIHFFLLCFTVEIE